MLQDFAFCIGLKQLGKSVAVEGLGLGHLQSLRSITAIYYLHVEPDKFNVVREKCNEHGTIHAISSDFGDRMITQLMRLMVLLSKHF